MGFEAATIAFLLWGRSAGLPFDRVLTIGRWGLHVIPAELRAIVEGRGLDASPPAALHPRFFLRRTGDFSS
jgi:hypothetical protein